jgi:hypothetical protein
MIEHRAWIRAIENYLKGISETLPLDHQNCRFGAWLETDGPAHHGMRSAFDDLEPVHRQLHELAEALLELQAAGSNSEALLRLAELHDLRNDFLQRLKALVRENGQEAAKSGAERPNPAWRPPDAQKRRLHATLSQVPVR